MEELKPEIKYENLKRQIDFSYTRKMMEQEKFINEHWKGLNEEVKKLENIVKEDFSKILKCINLSGSKVINFKVKYNKKLRVMDVKITKWESTTGEILGDCSDKFPPSYFCPHSALAPIFGFMDIPTDPLIVSFKQKYFINTIREPDNYCNHKEI